MSKYKKISLQIAVCWFMFLAGCNAQSDSIILTYDEYMISILAYHPVAKQADLKLKLAKAEKLAARGNFDPVLTSGWNQKNFDDKRYYRQFQNKLQVPTRLGIDIVGGYENTSGVFLNPENKTDDFGLWNIGVEVNLLQGLLVDERRTALKQAEIFQRLAENQKQIIINELLYIASLAYLDWQKNYSIQQAIEENIEIADTYFENTRQSFYSGEKTAIDTLEAFIMAQDAKALLQANLVAIVKSRQNVENYLWFKDLPLELEPNTQPEDYTAAIFEINTINDIPTMVNSHPQILEKINKQSYLEVEQRMKREKLKPKLKAKYNPLIATSENSVAPIYSFSDYKWGIDFSMPLFLRSERANIERGLVKIEEITLSISDKRNELQNKIEGSLQQQAILQQQIILQTQNVDGYRQLLQAENEKFRYGESSVFLLNKRQEKYIDGQMKLIELNIKFQKELLNFLYYSNQLF
jgi:outer membrane protein TolC